MSLSSVGEPSVHGGRRESGLRMLVAWLRTTGHPIASGTCLSRGSAILEVAALALLLSGAPLYGQTVPDTTEPASDSVEIVPSMWPDSAADLVGTVASSRTGEPIAGARISFPDFQYGSISTKEGKFRIPNLPPGLYDVHVRYLGYKTNQRPVRLKAGHVTRVVFTLERDVLEVADLKVEVKQPERTEPRSALRRRIERGRGEIITRDQIEKKNPENTTDMLREIPGLNVSPVEFGQATVQMRGAKGSLCRPTVFLNGIVARGYEIDNLQPSSVQAIEVYRRASQAPVEFKGTGSPGCGVIVLWSRTGRSDGSR